MKISTKAWLASAMLPFFAFFSQNAAAVDAPVLADAYVNSTFPVNNFGNVTTLNVGNGATTFISFNLATLPAGTTRAKVAKATLLLWVNKIGAAGSLDVLPVTSAWTEAGITFNATPAIGNSAVTTVPVTAAAQYIAVDVSELVKTWIDYPEQNFGLAIAASTGQSPAITAFDSKENTSTAHAAKLDITLEAIAKLPASSEGHHASARRKCIFMMANASSGRYGGGIVVSIMAGT